MPNWCECDLYVRGKKDRVEEFLRFAAGPESAFDFNRFVPYPEQFAVLDQEALDWEEKNPPPWTAAAYKTRPRDGFNQGGYEWCCDNWGTKWNAHRVEVQRIGGGEGVACVEINFATAWLPPRPVVERAAELHPDLSFELRYFERGACFSGLLRYEEGKIVRDDSGPYYGLRGG